MTDQQSKASVDRSRLEAAATTSTTLQTLSADESASAQNGDRGRKRSRSPRNKSVFLKLRSSSLGRSLSNLRVRHGNRGPEKKDRPSSSDPRPVSLSSNEETPQGVSEAAPASPTKWKFFPRAHGRRPHAQSETGGHSMLRSMRHQLRQLRPRSRKSTAANGTSAVPPDKNNEAVAEWLGQNPVTTISPQSTQSPSNDTMETGIDTVDDAPVLARLVSEQAQVEEEGDDELEDREDRDDDELSLTLGIEENGELPASSYVVDETTTTTKEDDESTWTEGSRLTELLKRSVVKGKDPNYPRAIQVWEISIHLISGSQLVIRDSTGTSDPYVKFKYNGKLLEKSKIVRRSLNPIWDEYFCFYIDDNKKPIELRVYDHDKLSDDYMGRALVDLSTLEMDSNTELTLELEDETGKSKEKFMGTLRLACKISTLMFDPDAASTTTTNRTATSRGNTTRGMPSKAVLLIKGIKSAIDTGRTRFKGNTWIATVTITLIEGTNLLPMDSNGLSDPFVKFRLGTEKYRSKVQKSTLNPRWLEQFDLRLSDECVEGGAARFLDITVWDHDDIGRNDFMGRAAVDLSKLRREHTHLVEQELEDGAGLLRMLVTISGTFEPDSVTDLRNYNVSEVDRRELVAKYGLFSTFTNMHDVGWLQVKVLKAEGLVATAWSGKLDPFCVVELVNSRLQTHTEYKTCDPEWNKVFVFTVHDIHACLEVTIFDEDRDKKSEVIGKVAVPLLRIRNGEKRWYALKDRKLMRRVKGAVLLEMDFIYNQIRAAWRTINPKEHKYALPDPKFKIAIMRRHIDRCGRIIDSFILFSQFVESCWSWESPARSILAFVSFMVIVWSFEPYMLPLTLVLIFSKEYVYNNLLSLLYRKVRAEDIRRDDATVSAVGPTREPFSSVPANGASSSFNDDYCVYATSTDDDEDKSDKEDRRTIKERIQIIQDTMLNVQEQMGSIASFFERIHNAFVWSVPWLSRFAVLVLIVATIILYLLPLRWLILAWGVNKFTKKLIRPNFIDNNELLDFLSRVPSSLQLLQYKETKPDISAASESKKR